MEIVVGTGLDRIVILVYFVLVMGFGAYFGNAESPIQGEGFADETAAERRRRRRRQRREAGDDGRPRRPRSATGSGSGSGSGSGRRRRHFESP